MSEFPKLVCATCGCERLKRFFRLKKSPTLCNSCYEKRPERKKRKKECRQRPEVRDHIREYARQYMKEYRQRPEEKERITTYQQKPEVRARYVTWKKEAIRKASDGYIKSLIQRESKGMLRFHDIPKDIIKLKRHALILKRAITEQQDEQHSTTDF